MYREGKRSGRSGNRAFVNGLPENVNRRLELENAWFGFEQGADAVAKCQKIGGEFKRRKVWIPGASDHTDDFGDSFSKNRSCFLLL